MNTDTQLWVNETVLSLYNALQYVRTNGKLLSMKRLRQCNAWVYCFAQEKGCIYILHSNGTYVAGITPNGTAIDWSRYVCCDLPNSAKHIAKFFNDYAPKDGLMFRYYPV